MAFLSTVAASRFPSTNNQLRTSFNLKNQATIQEGRVIMQQVQGRQGQSYVGSGYKGNVTSSRGNNAGGQARVVKCYNCQEQLAFPTDPGNSDGQSFQLRFNRYLRANNRHLEATYRITYFYCADHLLSFAGVNLQSGKDVLVGKKMNVRRRIRKEDGYTLHDRIKRPSEVGVKIKATVAGCLQSQIADKGTKQKKPPEVGNESNNQRQQLLQQK
uniref:Uncharacterized protein n=1 Tax=Tanacetum cinerariifolium TaxID=118510 RepID=A0A6L2LSE4_TANCI|nr:hypothetical protein [Tanacetum cinerariifolium]